jgi:hypothetical protein
MPIEPPVPYRVLQALLNPLRTMLLEVKERVRDHDHPSTPKIIKAIDDLVGAIETVERG